MPAVAPSDVKVEPRDLGTALITWKSLDKSQSRGNIIGYRVSITHNGTTIIENADTTWFAAQGLIQGHQYFVKVAAETGAGLGPWSTAKNLNMDTSSAFSNRDAESEATSILYAPPYPQWIMYSLVPIVILLVIVVVIVFMRRIQTKASTESLHPPPSPKMYSSTSVYPQHHINMYGEQKLWRPTECDKESSVSSTKLLKSEYQINEYAEPKFMNSSEATEPYATTALLISSSSPRSIRTIPSWRHNMSTDDENIEVNWLPPPPTCPPPAMPPDCVTSTGLHNHHISSGSLSHSNNNGDSEFYEKPFDLDCDHTYAVYTPVQEQNIPPHYRDEFHTFATLQSQNCFKSRPKLIPPHTPNSPRLNFHTPRIMKSKKSLDYGSSHPSSRGSDMGSSVTIPKLCDYNTQVSH